MNHRFAIFLVIAASFIAASMINVYPLSFGLALWRPMTLILVLIFWAIYQPRMVGVVAAFMVGLAADLLLDTHLGHQALCAVAMVFFLRLATNYTRRLSFVSVWIMAIGALVGYRCLLWMLELLAHERFVWSGFASLVVSILIFPVIWWMLSACQQALSKRSWSL